MRTKLLLGLRAARRGLLTIGAAAALMLHQPAPSSADPAMWVVKDEDSTLYLFGTFHLIRPETKWRSDKIDAAFQDSEELWLEASEGGDVTAVQALVLKHGMDPAHPLSSKLSSEDWAKVRAAAKHAGLPAGMLNGMRPWMAALTIAVVPVVREGYDPKLGADRQLEAAARTSKKIVKTFETPEQQLLVFASLPEQSEIAFLLQMVEEVAEGKEYVDRMADAWLAGNTGELEAMTLTKMKSDAPELYETMFVRRNMDWSDKIAAMMKGSGTSFIAVGAGHLIGEHSVQSILTRRGFTVTPY
ncbi:TraB/GumN family protein [Dongia deserti]|uniref:TraB/GumN family protein n=1 Tax=Dongia deserti TaxID=2268030 RepID=UPI000E64727B|nr:TraB/GumN family protein [Dongia deserti]